MPALSRLEVTEVENVRIIRFIDRHLFDEPTVREVSEQLFAAIPNNGKPIRLILDFSGVELISSSLIGKLIVLQRRVDASQGKLRLCELTKTVDAVMKTTNLDRLFAIDRDRAASLAAF